MWKKWLSRGVIVKKMSIKGVLINEVVNLKGKREQKKRQRKVGR